jgi:predicted flap endonuclease-1-like 5' DNA nuclease
MIPGAKISPRDRMANISEIEGVGEAYAAKLAEAGAGTVEKLLEAGAAKKGRQGLAEATGISEKLILKWVNHADLMRIKGVGPQMSELLEGAGVDSVAELAQRKPENLAAKLEEVNAEKNLVNRIPNAETVGGWVEEAKTLEKVVTH